jgi:hypothetical protein
MKVLSNQPVRQPVSRQGLREVVWQTSARTRVICLFYFFRAREVPDITLYLLIWFSTSLDLLG